MGHDYSPGWSPVVSGRRGSFPLVLEPIQARAIGRRVKTQLRRLATTVALADGSRTTRSCGLHVANTYEVAAGPAGEPLARIVVTDVQLQRLGDITPDDAQAEGHPSVSAFADWWLCRHDRQWPPLEEQLCPTCAGHGEFTNHAGEVVACDQAGCELGVVMRPVAFGTAPRDVLAIAARWLEHEERQVWVVSFRLDDRRFMHRHSQRGYTSNPAEAMVGEPEVIDAPDPRWVARSEQRRRQDQADTDATRLSGLPSIDDQLDELRRLAAERGVDLTRERAVIDRTIAKAARKVQRGEEAAA